MTKLQELGILLQRVQDFQNTKEQLEGQLKECDKRIARLTEHDIPAMMDSLGAASITTDDGWEIKVTETYHPSLTDENKPQAFKWLRDNGHGALIKNKVEIQFNAGEDAEAVDLAESLLEKGLPVSLNESIHHQTLKGFVNERMAEKDDGFPSTVFGIYHKREAKMKRKQ